MKVPELKKNPIIIEWLPTANVKPNSEKSYLHGMQDFTEYTGKDPETLLEEAENDIRAGKLMRQRSLKRYLIGFSKHLQDEGKAPLTIKSRLTGVKSFFETFDIEIPKLPRVGKAKPLEKNNEIPTKEDLQDVMKVADPLERVLKFKSILQLDNEFIYIYFKDITYTINLRVHSEIKPNRHYHLNRLYR